MSGHEEFNNNPETTASLSYPKICNDLKKNDYIILKKCPCKIVEIHFSKTGKHGHMKAHIVGIDIFSDKKYEDIIRATKNVDIPLIKRNEYELIDIDENNICSLLLKNGELLENIEIVNNELEKQIKNDFNLIQEKALNKNIVVSLLTAMDISKIVSYKILNF